MSDIRTVANKALGSSEFVLAQLLPHGRREGPEWVSTNPTRNDNRPGSFKVNTHTGQWSDFATGDKGGDLVSLYAYLNGTNQGEAAKQIDSMLGGSVTPSPIKVEKPKVHTVKAADHKEAARMLSQYWIDKGFRPQSLHAYNDKEGKPIFWRVRLKHEKDGKKIFPMRFDGDGIYAKAEPQFPYQQKPIYGQLGIHRKPDATVYVVEGEACADALRRLGIVATTSGGETSANFADWSPLSGRDVVIWPDNDQPGRQYAEAVKAKVKGIAKSVRVVDVAKLQLPEKGDCVDWLASNANATEADIAALPVIVEAVEQPATITIDGPEPLPNLPEVMPLNYDALPYVLREYVKDIADRMQCPPDFAAVSCLVMCGTLIGRKIGIRPKRQDNWTVPANLWGMIVGKSGIMKSPAMSAALAPLRQLQAKAHEEHKSALKDYEADSRVAKFSVDEAEGKARSLVKQGNADDAAAIIRKANDSVLPPPTAKRYIVNDSTVEALAETLEENQNGVLVDRDELSGWLRSLDKEGQQEARAFYLTAADGDKGFTTDRIGRGRGKHISAVTVSIIGGIQPGVLASYVRETQRGGAGDDGLLQRFGLIVYPDVTKDWKNIDRKPDLMARQRVDSLIEELCNLTPETVGAEVDEFQPIPFLRFTHPAQSLFDEWREDLERKIRADDEHPAMVSHLSKYRKLVPSLALINHLCAGGRGPVSDKPLAQALQMAEYLESHARRVYSYASRPDVDAARTILGKLKSGKLRTPFKAQQVYRAGWSGLTTTEEAWSAIRLLADHGYLFEIVPKDANGDKGGRPAKPEFHAHPAIWGAK